MTNIEMKNAIRKAEEINEICDYIKDITISEQLDATFILTVVHRLMVCGRELQEKVIEYQLKELLKH